MFTAGVPNIFWPSSQGCWEVESGLALTQPCAVEDSMALALSGLNLEFTVGLSVDCWQPP